MLATSDADLIACFFTLRGSTMPFSSESPMSPVYTSRPAFLISLCFARSASTVSIPSIPALTAISFGMTSIASANAVIASCSRPPMVDANARSSCATSISAAPPPGTIFSSSIAFLTTCNASSNVRSRLSVTCSVAPLSKIVTVFELWQSLM